MEWKDFYDKLKGLEKKYNIKLHLSRKDFNITPANVLKKPRENGDFVKAIVICPGKFAWEKLCSGHDRIISVKTKKKQGKTIGAKITRSKYNVFYGQEI